MGLDRNGLKFLLHAGAIGIDFKMTAALGRQMVHTSPEEYDKLRKSTKFILPESKPDYFEPVLQTIGAEQIDVFDYSTYEGASIEHDFNTPISQDFHGKYSCFIEAGSWEHIFSFKHALENSMNLVEPGGHLLAITPANNYCGHGFYTFSPELFFQCLNHENGYRVAKYYCFEDCREDSWWQVAEPKSINRRVMIHSSYPVYSLIIAQRIHEHPVELRHIQQSDYSTQWHGGTLEPGPSLQESNYSIRRFLSNALPDKFRNALFRKLTPSPFRDPSFNGPVEAKI